MNMIPKPTIPNPRYGNRSPDKNGAIEVNACDAAALLEQGWTFATDADAEKHRAHLAEVERLATESATNAAKLAEESAKAAAPAKED